MFSSVILLMWYLSDCILYLEFKHLEWWKNLSFRSESSYHLTGTYKTSGVVQPTFGRVHGMDLLTSSVTCLQKIIWVHQHRKWNGKFLSFAGEDEFTMYVWWTTVFSFLVYWLFGLIYVFLDVINRPKFLRKYKIQPATNEPIEKQKLFKVILHVIFNQLFVGIPFAIMGFYAMKIRGIADIRTLPTFHRVLFELAICILVEELGFYYSHRWEYDAHCCFNWESLTSQKLQVHAYKIHLQANPQEASWVHESNRHRRHLCTSNWYEQCILTSAICVTLF